jgi:hypothetical protein
MDLFDLDCLDETRRHPVHSLDMFCQIVGMEVVGLGSPRSSF